MNNGNVLCETAIQTANEAIKMATVMSAKHDSHELTCSRRYEDWRAASARAEKAWESVNNKLDQKINGVYKILWGTSSATILVLVGAIGALTFYLLTGGKHSG